MLVRPLHHFMSRLPFPLMYGCSDVLFVIVYYIVNYRKDVVLTNLRKSFPQLGERELHRISRDFYRHFCDVIFETVKLLTISREQFVKRCAITPHGRATCERYI